jgi:Cell division protein
MTSADSVYARARQLVAAGNGAAGRVLVDSMVAAAAPATPAYAEAVYWRAALAATSADAERDYRRIVVEYPLSPRTGDALLKLAQLELARGDRAPALTHLERFLVENPQSTERSRAGLQFVRLAFEQNEPEVGCTFLGRILREVPDSEVELRNQLSYYSPRCSTVDTTHVTEVAKAPEKREKSAKEAAPKREGGEKHAAASTTAKGRYTLQVAAYAVRAEAERLAKRLKDRGLEARVVGSKKPYRVRIGRYPTRAAATTALKELKAKKIEAIVTESGTDDK